MLGFQPADPILTPCEGLLALNPCSSWFGQSSGEDLECLPHVGDGARQVESSGDPESKQDSKGSQGHSVNSQCLNTPQPLHASRDPWLASQEGIEEMEELAFVPTAMGTDVCKGLSSWASSTVSKV